MRPAVEAYRAADGWVAFVRGRQWPGIYETQTLALRAGALSERPMANSMAAATNRVVTQVDLDAMLAGTTPGAMRA